MRQPSGNVELKAGSERNFGIVFAAVCLLVAVLPIARGAPPRLAFLILAAAFAALAFFAPRLLRVPNLLWFRFGILLGNIVAPIVMTLVYLVTFVPMAIGLRLMGKDLLSLRLEPQAKSYWIERPDPPRTLTLQY